jgi:simple sugar transport system permease protein
LLGVGIALIVIQLGISEGNAFERILKATVGSRKGVENVLELAAPLMATGLAAAIAIKLGAWNVGVEGQFFMGAWAAAGIAFALDGLSGPPLLTLMFMGAIGAGAVWMLIPALARAYLNVSEILTTLMLNFVAMAFLAYWATGPWRDPRSQGAVLATPKLPEQTRLPTISIAGVEIGFGIIIGMVLATLLAAIFRKSVLGYMVTTVGASERAGAYAGIKVRRLLVTVLLASGAVAGLAGMTHMTGGAINRYSTSLSSNTGYTGIAVAVLAGGSFLGTTAMALVLGAIIAAGNSLRILDVGSELGRFGLTGFILLMAAVGEGLSHYRLIRRSPIEVVKIVDSPPTAITSTEDTNT